ncbi:MAG: hypothetical protein ACE14O_06510 [Candidatus Cloacimonadaceae bacterium]
MGRIVLAFIILLLVISYGYADGLPSEEAERQAKERQMEQVAVRFKAETGFRGEINYDFERMKLGSYEGKFVDIPFAADADTTAFRQVSNRILDKILPYSLAKRNQLSMIMIKRQGNYTSTDYFQMVNGHRVEGSGFIVITYDAGRNRFDIGDNTAELPDEPLGEIITEAEAYQLAFDQYKKSELYDQKYPARGKTSILYKSREEDGVSQPYRLCWKISFPYISYYVDAITKETFSQKHIVLDN